MLQVFFFSFFVNTLQLNSKSFYNFTAYLVVVHWKHFES